MSADNWTVCPRCQQQRDDDTAKAIAEVAEQYGKISIREWEKLRAESEKLIAQFPEDTVREDYEIYGFEDGVVVVTYSGRCTKCDLGVHFNYTQPVVWD